MHASDYSWTNLIVKDFLPRCRFLDVIGKCWCLMLCHFRRTWATVRVRRRRVEGLVREHGHPQQPRLLALFFELRRVGRNVVDGARERRLLEIGVVVDWREHVTVPDEVHVHGRRVQDVVARSARVGLDQRDPTLTVPSNCIGNLGGSGATKLRVD